MQKMATEKQIYKMAEKLNVEISDQGDIYAADTVGSYLFNVTDTHSVWGTLEEIMEDMQRGIIPCEGFCDWSDCQARLYRLQTTETPKGLQIFQNVLNGTIN